MTRIGDDASAVSDNLQPWASASFAGARHRWQIALHGSTAADRAVIVTREAPAWEFVISGHIVAEIAVVAVSPADDGVIITIEALSVEEC